VAPTKECLTSCKARRGAKVGQDKDLFFYNTKKSDLSSEQKITIAITSKSGTTTHFVPFTTLLKT
jgi:hypothetical protein